MTDEGLKGRWSELCARQIALRPDVARGRMMSADALTHAGKVFVFFSTRGGRTGLGLRLGRDYPVESLGLTDWQHLAPFKTKPPLKDWIVAGAGDADRWNELAELALSLATNRED